MKGLDKPKVNNSSYFTIGENNHNIIPKSCQLEEIIDGIMSKAKLYTLYKVFTIWSSQATHHIMAVRVVARKYSSSVQKMNSQLTP
jgi:hypothetical protein